MYEITRNRNERNLRDEAWEEFRKKELDNPEAAVNEVQSNA